MKLKKFSVVSGGQFNPDKTGPVVIDFSKSKMVGATGDETTGKSTILELFLMACGQNGGTKVVEALKNRDNKEIDVELSFVGNDKSNYDVKVKNGRITVKKEGIATSGGPVELLKQQLGVVGVSPMAIKTAPIADIVKWLASYSTKSAEEFEKEMKKLKEGMKLAKGARADANKAAKANKEYLKEEGYIDDAGDLIEKNWLQSEKNFASKPDISDLSKKLSDAGKKSDNYLKVGEHLKSEEANEERQIQEVKKLKKELADKEAELAATQQQILKDKEWLEKNKASKTEYDAVKKQYDNAAQDVANHNKWLEIVRKREEMEGYEEMAQKADSKEKKLLKEQQELQWEVIPDIQGLELILEDTHEDEGVQKKAGFYINGMSSAQMSNSEWLGSVIKILKKNKVPVLVIDDVSQFGSTLMATLEGLVKSGCYVVYAEMKRTQMELEIEYK